MYKIKTHSLLLVAAMTFLSACNDNKKSTQDTPITATKVEPIQQAHIYETDIPYDEAKDGVEMAITDLGLIISGTMHISDMLNRTGKDIGIEKPIFKNAEGIEFCSAIHSHKMSQSHPSNIAMCPFTIVIYEKNDVPNKTFLSFRDVKLMGDGTTVETEIFDLLEGVVKEVID
ncbi:MAG: Unknown protein [uncultured Thiotrichaceae bacterium]|uniref:Uncharacterized protein n=1 Tax=uncultured Thiotrichaceae bacterium TaxID=298394 RepID=A0A6S6UI49_9GAMM|nr:MAG: Unknown protein [uncultured Thiotrichaceae bacterium]